MQDRVGREASQQLGDQLAVEDIGAAEVIARIVGDRVQRFRIGGVGQLVDIEDRGAELADKQPAHRRADKTGAAGNQDFHRRQFSAPGRPGSILVPFRTGKINRVGRQSEFSPAAALTPDDGAVPLPAFWALPEPTLSAACLLNSWFSKRERPQARSAPESHTDNCKFFRRFLADRCPGRRGGRQPARMPLPSIRSAYRGRVQAVLRRLRRPAMTAQPHQSRAEQGERPRLGNGDGARCAVDPARSI